MNSLKSAWMKAETLSSMATNKYKQHTTNATVHTNTNKQTPALNNRTIGQTLEQWNKHRTMEQTKNNGTNKEQWDKQRTMGQIQNNGTNTEQWDK